MKTLLKLVGMGLLGGFSLGGPLSASAVLEVSAAVRIQARTDFEVPLAAHGSWAEIRSYGRCWRPTQVAVGWRPYFEGRWVWTDCGWYWESDEPWAWACYHYGRWVYESELGWFWVPDIEWAPAWVHWRVGGGFIGWAPCPPRGVVITPSFFSFVVAGHFHERVRPASVVINDQAIINQTKEITEVKRASRTIGGIRQKVVINEGPGVAVVQKAVGHDIRATPIQDAVRQSPPPAERREAVIPGNQIAKPNAPEVVRPPIAKPDAAEKLQPSAVAPSEDEKLRPSEAPKKAEPPARSRESRGNGAEPDHRKGREHGKAKP